MQRLLITCSMGFIHLHIDIYLDGTHHNLDDSFWVKNEKDCYVHFVQTVIL
jgi:hypothetical protein